MTFGSLFAGIGGMDLGLERAGMRCVWQVEIDPYCRRVLAKHWPNVRRWDDVRTFPPDGEWGCDIIAGGFPCQDISNAGRRAGIDGERSGLWSEFARIVRVVRPRYVLVENVAALLGRGIGRVVGDLAECGYDAEWDCIPAAAVGALHVRNRVFLLAYATGGAGGPDGPALSGDGERQIARETGERRARRPRGRSRPPGDDSNPEGFGSKLRAATGERPRRLASLCLADVHDTIGRRHRAPQETVFAGRRGVELPSGWAPEPDVGRVADGVPARVDRLRGLGNAVVPQVAEWIGRRLMESTT